MITSVRPLAGFVVISLRLRAIIGRESRAVARDSPPIGVLDRRRDYALKYTTIFRSFAPPHKGGGISMT